MGRQKASPEQISEWIAFLDQLMNRCDPKIVKDQQDLKCYRNIRQMLTRIRKERQEESQSRIDHKVV